MNAESTVYGSSLHHRPEKWRKRQDTKLQHNHLGLSAYSTLSDPDLSECHRSKINLDGTGSLAGNITMIAMNTVLSVLTTQAISTFKLNYNDTDEGMAVHCEPYYSKIKL